MKKMKRLVAVLLVGIMALAMLTACGGTGNDAATAKFEASVEQAYMAKLNEKLNETYGKKFENDADIKKSAVDYIGEMAGKENLGQNDFWKVEKLDEKTQNWVMICYDVNQGTGKAYVKSSYEAGKAETIETKNIDTFFSLAQMKRANVAKKAKFTALGVGAKTINGKTYVAIGFKVEG
ncbi:MAG: hypothetical protein ACLU9R_14965 [Faecalibacterium sp.]